MGWEEVFVPCILIGDRIVASTKFYVHLHYDRKDMKVRVCVCACNRKPMKVGTCLERESCSQPGTVWAPSQLPWFPAPPFTAWDPRQMLVLDGMCSLGPRAA